MVEVEDPKFAIGDTVYWGMGTRTATVLDYEYDHHGWDYLIHPENYDMPDHWTGEDSLNK